MCTNVRKRKNAARAFFNTFGVMQNTIGLLTDSLGILSESIGVLLCR